MVSTAIEAVDLISSTNFYVFAATVFELTGKDVNVVRPEKYEKIHHIFTNHSVAAVFAFPNNTIISSVGTSLITTEEACRKANAKCK